MSIQKNTDTVISVIKLRAKNIKKDHPNTNLILADVLEAIADYYNLKDWNIASAKLKNIPFNLSLYPEEDSNRLNILIDKVYIRRRKKSGMSYKKNINNNFFDKFFHKFPAFSISNNDFRSFSINNAKISDDYIFSINKMLASIYIKEFSNDEFRII